MTDTFSAIALGSTSSGEKVTAPALTPPDLPGSFTQFPSSCGGAESRSADAAIGASGLTGSYRKCSTSQWEGETTPLAGVVAPGPQDHFDSKITTFRSRALNSIVPNAVQVSDV